MKEHVDKFIQLEKDISQEKGDSYLFALFLREDSQNKWDLLISAPWLERNRKKGLKYIADRVQESLRSQDLLQLSRIVVVSRDNPALEAIIGAIGSKHAKAEVKDSNFFGVPIQHAYIITSQRPSATSGAAKAI